MHLNWHTALLVLHERKKKIRLAFRFHFSNNGVLPRRKNHMDLLAREHVMDVKINTVPK